MKTTKSKARLVKPEDLMGVGEVAELVGLSQQRLNVLRKEGRFVEPFVNLSASPIWLRPDVAEWVRKRAS